MPPPPPPLLFAEPEEERITERMNGATLDLAEAQSLTTPDASYLWVAPTLGAELVTLDRKLAAAAR